MTVFQKITASPEALGGVLASLSAAEAPWDKAFREVYCQGCGRENCDTCPHEEYRNNPVWWLRLEAGIPMLTRKSKQTGYYSPYKKEDLVEKLGPIEQEAERLLQRVCEERCVFRRPPLEPTEQEEMDEICENCPLSRLGELMGV